MKRSNFATSYPNHQFTSGKVYSTLIDSKSLFMQIFRWNEVRNWRLGEGIWNSDIGLS